VQSRVFKPAPKAIGAGFFVGDRHVTKPRGKQKEPEKQAVEPVGKSKTPTGRVTRRGLVKKAYQRLQERLEAGNGKAIDDLVKLVKLEQDLSSGEAETVKEIKVRWESSEEESSNEG